MTLFSKNAPGSGKPGLRHIASIAIFAVLAIIVGTVAVKTGILDRRAGGSSGQDSMLSSQPGSGSSAASSGQGPQSAEGSSAGSSDSLPESGSLPAGSSAVSQTSAGNSSETSPQPSATPTDAQEADFIPQVGIWYSTWYAKLDPSTPGYTTDNRFPQFNTWIAWNIPYLPLGPSGNFETYDSLDEEVLSYHIKVMTEADIDFIIMDQTNNIDVENGYINARSIKMAQTIKKWNDTPGHQLLKYSSAIGAFQFTGNPASIEIEAKMIYERYNSQDFGGPDYQYYLDGKPLLVIYAGNTYIPLWDDYSGSKTYAEKFTIRWANNANTPGYYGWAYNRGSVYNEEAVVVMPGWRNNVGATPVLRSAGEWYRDSWDVVLKAEKKPKIVVINSFNEYAERTAVWTADTSPMSGMPNELDKWRNAEGEMDPDMYWEMTVENIREYKG